MSLGWVKKSIIEITTKDIIKAIILDVDNTLRVNPRLTLEEALRTVDKNRGILLPDEQDITKDLHGLFAMMVWKAYLYKRASDPHSATQEHLEFVLKIAHEYMNMVLSKTKDDMAIIISKYEALTRENPSKTSDAADSNILGASLQMTCRKCGHAGFDYDQYWKEYTCKNCGWQTK